MELVALSLTGLETGVYFRRFKNGLMEDGSYIYKGIRIIPDYNGAISVSAQKTDIILVDSGHSMRKLEMIRILWILLLRIMHI